MKIDYAIHASDDNKFYLDFWPLVSKLWKLKFNVEPVLLHFGTEEVSSEYGTVIKMDVLEDYPVAMQAQCSRYFYATTLGDNVGIISDIDMLPLSKNYYINSIEDVEDDKYVHLNPCWITDTYPHIPACYHVAKGDTFKNVLGEYANFKEYLDWATTISHSWSTDELSSTQKIFGYEDQDIFVNIERPGGQNGFRIDRPNWVYDLDLVSADYYFDAHCPRPYQEHKESIDSIIEYALQSYGAYGTHLPILNSLINNHDIRSVYEFGMGEFSTGLFADNCEEVYAHEMQSEEWFQKMRIKLGNLDNVNLFCTVGPWDAIHHLETLNRHFDMIFVDGHGDSRWAAINMASRYTNIIVTHDTETSTYNWERVQLDESWTRIDYKGLNPWTTVWIKS